MNVLIYNWCPLNNREGGGVAVYVKNLTEEMPKYFNIYFLNSGFYFDDINIPYIRESLEQYDGIRSFDLVNSPVFAPMKSPVSNFDEFLNSSALNNVFKDFLVKNNISVVHFNNFEGLPLDVLKVKDDINGVRFIYSIHNYALFCPCVNLWTSDNKNCYTEPGDCTACMAKYQLPSMARKITMRKRKNAKFYYLGRVETHVQNAIGLKLRPNTCKNEHASATFDAFRTKQVEYINKYFDAVLPVSKRVAEIAESFGVDRLLLQTEYIGSKFAQFQVATGSHSGSDECLRLVFLGYMKVEKGLGFLVDSLALLDDETLAKIDFSVAAKLQDLKVYCRLKKLEKRLHSLSYYNGYDHEQLPGILQGQDLGVVPVLWEDNLPQIAIELACKGIPVLSSSFGGASEIANSDVFKFKGGDSADLNRKITAFINDRTLLDTFWETKLHVPTMDDHIKRLLSYYQG